MHGVNALFNWFNIINLIQVDIQIMFIGMSCFCTLSPEVPLRTYQMPVQNVLVLE